jgi:hypothetical protein
MKDAPDRIDLIGLANDLSGDVASMVGELEGTGLEELLSVRWPSRFLTASEKDAPARWTNRFATAGPKTAPSRR